MQPVPIIIPYRGERETLPLTVRGIRKTADIPYHIYIVCDDPSGAGGWEPTGDDITCLLCGGWGLSRGRHIGLEAAGDEAGPCVLLDAHMSFIPGSDWLSRLTEKVRRNPKLFVSSMSVRCTEENWQDPVWHLSRGRVECGSRLVLYQICSGGRPEILGRKWRGERDVQKTIDVACPLGGAYAIDRDWYVHDLRGPWQFHRGWGCSEQLVALATWYRGGKCRCVPVPIGHMYRKTNPNPTQIWKLLYNGLLAARLFMPDGAVDLFARLFASWAPEETGDAIGELSANNSEISKLRKLYQPDKHWPEFAAQWVERPDAKQRTRISTAVPDTRLYNDMVTAEEVCCT